jgi:beta-aspartyl-peptidase (threonine type)
MSESGTQRFSIALHGGAGTLLRAQMTTEKEKEYREAMAMALRRGEDALREGQSALDAVIKTVAALEDAALFNAGVGAVFTHEGHHELDASLMEGKTRKAGAVCAVKTVRNPILLCREIMNSEFVMLNGIGAEEFARTHGFEAVDNTLFSTDFRRQQLNQAKAKGIVQLDHSAADEVPPPNRYGTVGAVAIDRNGNLAAATSTGGMTNKRYGRIGDSAIIGAGTWADNRSCAVSATGHGEFFIRSAVASRIASMVEFGEQGLEEAAHQLITHEVGGLGGDGGVVALDAQGQVVCVFNSLGMYRAWIQHEGPVHTAIFNDDDVVH